jgi:hypothetical protein
MLRLHRRIDPAHLGTCNCRIQTPYWMMKPWLATKSWVWGWGWGIVLTLLRRGQDSAELYASQVSLARDKPHIRHFMHLRMAPRVHPLHGCNMLSYRNAVYIVHLLYSLCLPGFAQYLRLIKTDSRRPGETMSI